MYIKEELLKQCDIFIKNRLNTIQENIRSIQNALLSETKSSVGDKHETGRAMLQLEREKAGQQLAEVQKVNEVFSKINIAKPSKVVSLGSVVYTSMANYFIAISAGEISTDEGLFYAVSTQTPIAKLMLFKRVGETIKQNGLSFTITEIK